MCWTSERRRRHGLTNSADCALCGQADESIDHLLVSCVFSREVWFKTLSCFGWQLATPPQNAIFTRWWLHWCRRIARPRRRAFDSVVAMTTRLLWLQHNEKVFRGLSSTPDFVLQLMLRTCDQWCAARLLVRSELYGK
jgi:hypothetical protein